MKKIIFIFITILIVLSSFLTADITFASMLASGSGETVDYYSYEEGEQDLPPKAVLRVRNDTGNLDQLSGTTSTKFTFDGNGSTDEETSTNLLEVRFDFENDGQVDTYFSVTRNENYVYETPGLKTVRMEVLDRGGNVSSTTQKIYIVENTAPEAYFSINPKVGTPATEFILDSSSSSDSQYRRNLLEYRYDFNTDGEWDTKFKKTTLVKHNFDYPGIKNITMEVRDPEGVSSFYKQTVYVRQNRAPIAKIESTPTNENGHINLDGGNSYDPDGNELQYKWDFNYTGENDIMWDTSWTSSNSTFVTFKKSGEYLVRLLVRDADGETDESIITVFVTLLSDLL
ncbi:hypothetical protein C0416_05120 [bacterium]|nr:hypothetical protein [bacterium]